MERHLLCPHPPKKKEKQILPRGSSEQSLIKLKTTKKPTSTASVGNYLWAACWLCGLSGVCSCSAHPGPLLTYRPPERETFWALSHPHQRAQLGPALLCLRLPSVLGTSLLSSSDALRCVNTLLDTHPATVFRPQSASLNFGSGRMISAFIFLLLSPTTLSLIFFSSACVSLFLWGNYVSLCVCGQRYILCKVDQERESRTCRSCSPPLMVLVLGCLPSWCLLSSEDFPLKVFFSKIFLCLQMRRHELKREKHRSNTTKSGEKYSIHY